MIGKIASVQTDDRNFQQYQQNVQRTMNPILNNPILDGIILERVVLATGDNFVSHTLGRRLLGWIPVRRRAAATLFDKQDTNPNIVDTTLVLNASAPVTVDLYVF